jgi:hypothetical protein
MQSITTIDSIDIILTPQFYTFLREELGVRFAYQAKQIAPSLFDDYLDMEREYQFHTYKCEEEWCFFAYSVDEIVSFLESRGVKAHQINKIFFAQELSPYIESAIDLGSSTAMQSIDGIVTIMPKRLISSEYRYAHLDIDTLSLKNGIALGSSYSSLIPLKETIIITSTLIIFGVIFFIEGGRYKSSIESIVAKEERLLETNSKLSSNRVRKSILKKYIPIDRDERAKRDTLKEISKLIFSESRLNELTIEDKKISVRIKTKNSNITRQIEQRSKNFKIKKEKSNIIKMERTL